MIRYNGDLGCRYRGIPHDMVITHETPQTKWEVCQICGKKFRWNKGHKGRIDSADYLKAHVRNFAQRFGATKRVYNKIYNQNKLKIVI